MYLYLHSSDYLGCVGFSFAGEPRVGNHLLAPTIMHLRIHISSIIGEVWCIDTDEESRDTQQCCGRTFLSIVCPPAGAARWRGLLVETEKCRNDVNAGCRTIPT